MSDKEMNFRALEAESQKWQERALAAESALDAQPTEEADTAELDQWKAKAEIAEATAHRGILMEAGFLPDSGEAKALLRDLSAGTVEADPASIVTHASEEYDWSPNMVLFSKGEAVQIESARMQKAIRNATVSDDPPNIDDEIAEAQQAGSHAEALRLTTRQAAERMLKG